VGLNALHPTHGFANLGYWVRTDSTSRGVATRATRLIARFGFEELGLARLEIVVAVENQASLRVAEKAGATREGILRNRLAHDNGFADAMMFSLIPQDLDLPSASREAGKASQIPPF
jgi:RimJ/RimL family protein N-acetyltransferase